ncbi:MAG: TIGR03000 domain-containing protein [Planctomycetes bacterium]|nr:TIGR03000 domain-containing protein [Planctomycetota bacterium]
MTRSVALVVCTLILSNLVNPANAQQPASAQLRVTVPHKHAKLRVDEHLTKQTGIDRLFVTPPLERGATFAYTLTVSWEKNNYTEVIRTRVVHVKAGQTVDIDLRHADDKNPDKFVIRFVPTPDEVVEAMCKLAKVGKDDVVYDLGCGDGRIVITAVTQFKAKRGVGVDIDPELVKLSQNNAKDAKVSGRVVFRAQDVLTIKDLGDASVVMLYMGEDVNLRLMPILKSTLKPGSRIVSHDFKMGNWMPEQKIDVIDEFGDEHYIYLWTIK